jgi:hypothetical protein
MVILSMVVVLVVVGLVYAAHHRPVHVTATGNVQVGAHRRPAISPVGRRWLITLTGAVVWSLIFATPLLLIPLVPLWAALSAAFVLLQSRGDRSAGPNGARCESEHPSTSCRPCG